MEKPEIIFEDLDIIVIDKPAGLIVNKSDTTKNEKTLQDIVEKKINFSDVSDPEFISRGGIVHRLDKETSGIIIVAKNPISFRELQNQFKKRIVDKEYLALLHGKIFPEKGVVRVPIGRLPWNRKRFGVLAGGRDAETDYELIKTLEVGGELCSFVKMMPKTGRTHQIRVQMKHLGHPVFSDPLYVGRKMKRSDRNLLDRLFLHASRIRFVHPRENKEVVFYSDLPEELKKIARH